LKIGSTFNLHTLPGLWQTLQVREQRAFLARPLQALCTGNWTGRS